MTRTWMRVGGACTALLLGACSTLHPVEPVHDESRLIDEGAHLAGKPLGVVESAHLLRGWRAQLEDAASSRQKGSIAASEVLFYGTLLAFAGATGNFEYANRVRNVGAAAAGGSSLFTARYQQEAQRLAFRKGADRMICGERAAELLGVVAPDELFPKAELAAIQDKANAVPAHTRRFIDRQRIELQAALQAITLSALTPEQLQELLNRYKEAGEAGKKDARKFLEGKTDDTPAAFEQRLTSIAKAEQTRISVASGKGSGKSVGQEEQKQINERAAYTAEARRKLVAETQEKLDAFKARYTVAVNEYPAALDLCMR